MPAAYSKQVKESAVAGGAGAYTIINGLNSAQFSFGGTVLDDTAFMAAPDGFISRFLGLNDCTLTMSGDYVAADAGQLAVIASKVGRTEIWFQYLPNGVAGFKFRGVVETWQLAGEVNGKEQVSITIQGDGGYATV